MPTPERVGELAADIFARQIAKKPDSVLGVATGSSPLTTYQALAKRIADENLDTSQLSAFALDEYIGLPYDHDQSYHYVINETVTKPLGLDPARVHVPAGMAENPAEAGREYERAIEAAGGVDVQMLGVGGNGHIGFNEPSSSLASRTRVKTLAPKTVADNARFFDKASLVPTHCLTQGIGTIMSARRLVLVANGASKADAVAALAEGPVSAMCPASVLQMHERATVIIDEAAAAKLQLREYYEYVWNNKTVQRPE